MKKVVIYPGRFQPMLSHHAKVFDYLKTTFADYEVYIGTSNKVEEGKSPFNFKEKQKIAMAHGIDPNRVLEAQQPYVHTFYDQFNHEDTVVIFAVGEKDMNTRFAMNNVDPDTGLDMKVRPNKDTGEIEPKYYQMINSIGDAPLTMDKRGYLFEVPNQKDGDEVSSASAFREAFKNSPDKEAAKKVFGKQFKEYNEEVFNLIYNKLVGEKMSEDLNILRKMAGLEVDESAPVEFEDHVEVKDLSFTPPSKSTAYHSIANRFPEGSDVNDPAVKREEFIQALLRSPANLLAEINERISPADDNGLAASEKLNKIISVLEKDGANITDLKEDDKKFAMELVKKAIKEMDLDAGDDSEYEEEPKEENLDLSDIKTDYGVKEIEEGGDCYHCDGKDEDCEHCDGDGYVKFDDDPQEPSQEEIDDNEAAYKKYIGKHKKDESVEEGEGDLYDKLIGLMHDEEAYAKACGLSMKELDNEMGEISRDLGLHMDDDREAIITRHAEDQEEKNKVKESSEDSGEGSISDMSDEDLMDYVGQKEEDIIDDIQQHIAPDFLHKDNYDEMFMKYREEVLEPAAHEVSQDAADGMEPADAEESIEDTGNKALEAAMEELKKLAGLEEGECPKCGNKKHKLMACSSCGCS